MLSSLKYRKAGDNSAAKNRKKENSQEEKELDLFSFFSSTSASNPAKQEVSILTASKKPQLQEIRNKLLEMRSQLTVG